MHLHYEVSAIDTAGQVNGLDFDYVEIEGNGSMHVSSDQTFGAHIFKMVENAQERVKSGKR